MVLLAVVSPVPITKALEWSDGGTTPVKIWSVTVEPEVEQQTADLRERGPRAMQAARDDHQYMTYPEDIQAPSDPWRKVTAGSESRDAAPTAAGQTKHRLVLTTTTVCCPLCEAPYAVVLLHALAHGIGMLVVLCMWVMLTIAIFIRFL